MHNQALKGSALAVAGLALAFLAGCSKDSAKASAAPPPAPVRVAQAEIKTLPVEVRTIGNVEAYKTISVKSQVTGTLMRVLFKEGDPVRKGHMLFEIDPRPYQEALRQAEASLARDNALLRQAEANLARDTAQAKFYRDQAARYESLAKEGVFSRQQTEQAVSDADAHAESVNAGRASIESARSSLASDRASIDNAKLQLSYCYISSPVDGRTGNISVKEGNLVKANDIELVTVMQIQPVYVTFTAPEKQLETIRQRMRGGTLAVRATPQGSTADPAQGKLTFIDNMVDQNTGTIKLKGTFANSTNALWPGQFADVVLTLSQRPNVVAIPSKAVQIGQQGNFVYVLKPDQTVEMRTVVTGASVGSLVEVEKGVQGGESVVTDGHVRLAPGARVKVLS